MRGQKIPKPPGHLSKEAKAWWRKILAEYILEDDGLIILKTTLENYDLMNTARELLARDGPTITGSTGVPRPHPALTLLKAATSGFYQGCRLLGLNIEPPPGKGVR
ncbi:MAG: P27 family phage terminase small subunit [Bacillota bacterium]